MKLLIYSHAFAPQVGGIETVMEQLASGLSMELDAAGARRFDVAVVTQTAEDLRSAEQVAAESSAT